MVLGVDLIGSPQSLLDVHAGHETDGVLHIIRRLAADVFDSGQQVLVLTVDLLVAFCVSRTTPQEDDSSKAHGDA